MEQNKTIEQFGDELQLVLGKMDVPCFLCNISSTIISTVYEFKLDNLKKYKNLANAIDIINSCKHKQLRLGQSESFDFAIFDDIKSGSMNLLDNLPKHTLSPISALLGVDSNGKYVEIDFERATHTLISGATGMGKTTLLNNIIYSLTKNNSADEISLHLIDVKRTLTMWEDCPQVKSITCGEYPAYWTLFRISQELNNRLGLLSKKKLLKATPELCPYMFVIIDELADLMLSPIKKEIEEQLVHIAQVGRAVNICLILATQNPLVSICTSLIKANCPTRIALKSTSQRDSINILGNKHAYQLNGVGDCIIRPAFYPIEHTFKTFFLSDEQIKNYIKEMKK